MPGNRDIVPGRYRHFKGKEYQVLGVARFSEDPEQKFVVYRALYKSEFGENVMWVRPLEMFVEEVERDGKRVKRFELIEQI